MGNQRHGSGRGESTRQPASRGRHAGARAALAAALAAAIASPIPVMGADMPRGLDVQPAVPPSSATSPPASALTSARQRLEGLAQRQVNFPDDRATLAPPPPGAGAATLGAPSAEQLGRPEARLTLDDVLAQHARPSDPPPDAERPADAPAPTADESLTAVRLYVYARQKFLDHDHEGAITDLEHAVTLDPSGALLWLLLGEARLRAGRESEAMDALARSVQLGLEHPRPLLLLCSWNSAQGRHADAISLGGRAIVAPGLGDDPALAHMARASLADALFAAGYHRAGALATLDAFDLPASLPAGTAYASELLAMHRGGWDAMMRAGATLAALGHWPEALEAFAGATRFPTVDPARALPPLVQAAMALGRPAAAGLALIESIEQRGSAVDKRTLRLIRHIRDHTDTGPLLAAALTELDARVRGVSPAIEASMAMAVAAGLPSGLDRGPLVDAARRFPGNVAVLSALLASFDAGERDRALGVAAMLASESPPFAQSVGDAMIATGLRTPGDVERLAAMAGASPPTPGADLLRARLLIETGRYDDADAALGGHGTDDVLDDLSATRRNLLAASAMLDGRPDDARRLVDSWPTPANDAQRWLLVRTLALIGDTQRARDAAGDPMPLGAPSPHLEGEPGEATATWTQGGRALLFQACQLARGAQDLDATERLATRLVEADPFSDQGYGVLIALYSPPSPKADQARLGEVVRAIRERVPESALLRYLSARELAQAGRLAEADARLRGVAEDEPGDDTIMRALIEVWNARAAREGQGIRFEADAFLARLARDNPHTSGPAGSLAMLRLAQGQFVQGVDAFTTWLGRGSLLTTEDRARSKSILDPLLRLAVNSTDAAQRQAAAALLVALAKAGYPLDNNQVGAWMVLVARGDATNFEAIAESARLASTIPGGPGNDAFQLAVGGVLREGGPSQTVFALWREGAARPGGYTLESTTMWASMIAQIGSAQDLRDFFTLVPHGETLGKILQVLPGAPDSVPAELRTLQADFAYAISATTRVMDRPETAGESFLELALELDPAHSSAANDLGYQWADRGVNLARAEALLLMAQEQKPGEANVLDSLGWLRYKQGRLSDTLDESGGVAPGGEGAVTLLTRAAELLQGGAGFVTLDQLGDALWRVGRHDEAVARWQSALPLGESTVELYTSGNAPPSMLRDVESRLERVRAKIAAALALRDGSATDPPAVAPLGEGVEVAR